MLEIEVLQIKVPEIKVIVFEVFEIKVFNFVAFNLKSFTDWTLVCSLHFIDSKAGQLIVALLHKESKY